MHLSRLETWTTSRRLRIGILLTLLVLEVAWFASLRAFGWGGTNGRFWWISCLFVALLPLMVAVLLIGRRRFRFNMRTMLIVMALTASFLYLSVRPLQIALSSRHASESLLAVGTELRTTNNWDNIYARLKYDPRPQPATLPPNQELTFWLRPLAGNRLNVPVDNTVRVIALNSDEQVLVLCRNAKSFGNLEQIGWGSGVSPAAAETLRKALSSFTRLSNLHIDADVPPDFFRSLPNIRTLSLWAERPPAGRKISNEHLRDIAALPDLRVLWIFKYANVDADVRVLSNSKSLKRLMLKRTAATQQGVEQMSSTMPGCEIHRE